MSEKIVLYDLPPSPNNMKVRIAMNFKGIPFDRVEVDPQNRSKVVEVSGQPLTPVLAHGARVIFDSGAILRYLDFTFRQSPRLFSEDLETMKEIERWESFGRYEIEKPVGMIFRQYFAEQKDTGVLERASRMMHELTGLFEDRLAKAPWLVGDQMTAADITSAPFVNYSMLPEAAAAAHPIVKFFFDHLELGEKRERTRAWVQKIMAYDK